MTKKLDGFLFFLTLVFSSVSFLPAEEPSRRPLEQSTRFKIVGTTYRSAATSTTLVQNKLEPFDSQAFRSEPFDSQAIESNRLDERSVSNETNEFPSVATSFVPETKILVFNESRLIGKTTSDESGRFELNGLTPGDYILFAKNEAQNLSGVADISLDSTARSKQRLQFFLTETDDFDAFFQQKWNENVVSRAQMENVGTTMPVVETNATTAIPNAEIASPTVNHYHYYYGSGTGSYPQGYAGVGRHWGGWLAAGALTAAIVALAVDDDAEPVSPSVPRPVVRPVEF